MSEQPEKDEKQFEASAQKIRKAREDGNVFKSQEIVSVVSLSLAIGMLAFGGMAGIRVMKGMFAASFQTAPQIILTEDSLIPVLFATTGKVALALTPFVLSLMVAGVAMSVAQSGWNVSMKPLMPKVDRISPLKGMKRIFSSRGLFSAGKSFAKVAVVGPIAYIFIRNRIPELLNLHNMTLDEVMLQTIKWIVSLAAQLLSILFVLSAADFAFERHKYTQDLKMTFKEVKDENKENEGDPLMKSKRKALAQKLTRPRLDHAVMKSDVVITNPTHYAVALRYDPSESSAPRVMAKGMRKRALRIKALAFEYGVPVIENRPLARALYSATNELDEIPEDLYQAIAAILAEVYRNRNVRVA
jgi:flagellar biosynthetic protein FlhB